MSTVFISLDNSKPLDLYFRRARDASKRFVFKNEDGSAYAINGSTWHVNIKTTSGSSTNILQLTSGSGLTIGGVGNNEITISVTEATSDLPREVYYWELFNDTTNQTWISGEARFFSGNNPKADSTGVSEITLDLGDSTVEITLEGTITSIDGGTL
jgi:hypothetical protein